MASVKIATLVGCAIGDALGNPFEMWHVSKAGLQEWDGQFKAGGTFWVGEAGQYTDDTLMSMALAASLVENHGFDMADVGSKYLAWMESGNTRGIGGTTARALTRLKNGASVLESGVTHIEDGKPASGNGTAMRASPIGLWYRKDPEKLLEVAMLDASITHNSFEPKMGSVAVALGTALIANGMDDRIEVVKTVLDVLRNRFSSPLAILKWGRIISRLLRRSASMVTFLRQWAQHFIVLAPMITTRTLWC